MHSDGSGSKIIQNILHYKVTGDSVFLGYTADDTAEMNFGDAFSVNAELDGFVDYVAINRFTVPKEIFLESLGKRFGKIFRTYARYGITIPFMGGETADLPDQLRTADVSGTVYGHVKLSKAITGEKIKPGDVIIGIRSDGQAFWEDVENSGIMDNGLTLARHCLMLPDYEELYPEIRDPSNPKGGYYGKYRTDQFLSELGMTVGEALISPTRQFGILMKQLTNTYRWSIRGTYIHGIVHNTGGGQTKCLRIGENIHFVKDNLPEPPPIFYLIQQESGEKWHDMYQDFNMGIGVDVIVPEWAEKFIIWGTKHYGIEAQRTGYVEESRDTARRENGNMLTIKSRFGEFEYPENKE
jgi:phosphoribosylformylglycinamidine cyclo-ligase